MPDPGVAQHHGLFETGDAEGLRARERLGHGHEPVAIGIGLDDGHDPPAGRRLPHPLEVRLRGLEIDDDARRARHPRSPRP